MNSSIFSFLLVVTFGFYSGCSGNSQNINIPKSERPKNIILMIGDGMGLSQISLALMSDDIPLRENGLNLEKFNHIGLIKTYSSKDKITDSGAGATAFSIGEKTYNGAIGVDNEGDAKETILEYLESKGFATGVVATAAVTHATPASFYAHSKSRDFEEDIAEDLLNSKIDFFAGGGLQFFNKRKDGQNLISSFKSKGWKIETNALTSYSGDSLTGYLLAENGMPRISEGRGDFLSKATNLALDHLSPGKHGFFLMVEGSQIDWGGHANESDYILDEVLDFDKAIGEALEFAKKDGNTLVLVTADHETGGLALTGKDGGNSQIDPKFSTSGHTASLIPVFAFGPGADQFNGIYENTAIFHKMKGVVK